ncbi:MAG: AAA family ATPase, partial [Janthinobacterium lividum]
MPSLLKVVEAFSNLYVRIAMVALLACAAVGAAMFYKPEVEQAAGPVLQTQDISRITELPANKGRLEYLLIARPQSEFPRYVFKYRDSLQIIVVKVPASTHGNLEREILLKSAIPYAIARDDL